MNLVIFDIDGTLTQTMKVDTVCFIQAVKDVLGLDPTGMSWDDFPHVTDQGVFEVLWHRKSNGTPSSEQTAEFIDHFHGLMESARDEDPQQFAPIPGAADMLRLLTNRSGWAMTMATGAWRRMARMKLAAGGIPDLNIPLSTSDEFSTREGIVNHAIESAKAQTGLSAFDRIVSIGDGAWDVRTARNLDIPFVGIGSNDDMDRIGSQIGVANYLDQDYFLSLLETAPVP